VEPCNISHNMNQDFTATHNGLTDPVPDHIIDLVDERDQEIAAAFRILFQNLNSDVNLNGSVTQPHTGFAAITLWDNGAVSNGQITDTRHQRIINDYMRTFAQGLGDKCTAVLDSNVVSIVTDVKTLRENLLASSRLPASPQATLDISEHLYRAENLDKRYSASAKRVQPRPV